MTNAASAAALWLLALSVVLTPACKGGSDSSADTRANPTSRSAEDGIVASVDAKLITAADLDAAARSSLYDLDQARYRLRLEALERLIVQKVLGPEAAEGNLAAAFQRAQEKASIQILLEPPSPPPTASAGGPAVAQAADLPLILIGTVVHDDPARSMAIIRARGALVARNFRPGQKVLDDTVLERVDRTHVVLRRGSVLESLALTAADTPTPAAEKTPVHTISAPNTVTNLSRNQVDNLLGDVPLLDRQLDRSPLDSEGKRLLIVTGVEPGSLYDLLGLHADDVLMQVDGEWIDDQHNSLWDALRDRQSVRLLIMRAGFPRSFEYVIE